jgi:hypothetical protein
VCAGGYSASFSLARPTRPVVQGCAGGGGFQGAQYRLCESSTGSDQSFLSWSASRLPARWHDGADSTSCRDVTLPGSASGAIVARMDSSQHVAVEFRRGQASADEIQEIVNEVLAELGDPQSESAQLARGAGLEPEMLAGLNVTVSEEPGFGLEILVVAFVLPVAVHVTTTFWDDVVRPRLRRRLGAQAVGERIEADDHSG